MFRFSQLRKKGIFWKIRNIFQLRIIGEKALDSYSEKFVKTCRELDISDKKSSDILPPITGPLCWFPNFIRCSRTTPSNFSFLYSRVNFINLADKIHINKDAAIIKHPKMDPITMKIWQSSFLFFANIFWSTLELISCLETERCVVVVPSGFV